MKISRKVTSRMFFAALGLSVLGFSGCQNPFAKKNDAAGTGSVTGTGEVLLSIDGKPVLFVDQYEAQKEAAQRSNQQVAFLLQMMPDAEYNMLFKGMKIGALMEEWCKREGVMDLPEFKEEKAQLEKAINLQLCMKYYDEAHQMNVTDADAKKYYDEKRDDIQALQLTQGGVEVSFVRFENDKDAQAFLAKVKGQSAKQFEAEAKAKDLKVGNLMINEKSQYSPTLKDQVLALTKFPTQLVCKVADNVFWVVNATGKKQAEYRKFEEQGVKEHIKNLMKEEQKEKAMMSHMDQLEKEYNVTENKVYFDKKQEDKKRALETAQKVAQQAQGGSKDVATSDEEQDIDFGSDEA